MYVPICNRFHIIRANNGKMTSFFWGVPLFDALVRGEPPHTRARNFVTKNLFGGLWSFKIIDVDKSKKPVTSACYDKQHVCTYLQPFSHHKSQ